MFTFILVLLGVFFLCYAIFICKKMINSFTRSIHRRAGHIMLSLIIIFFLGYIIYMVFNYNLLFTNFIVSILLFLTAFFVTLVLHVNHSLIIRLTMKTLELKEFSENLWEQTKSLSSNTQQLEKIKYLLEEKNKELETALQKVSASNIEAAKELASKEADKAYAEAYAPEEKTDKSESE